MYYFKNHQPVSYIFHMAELPLTVLTKSISVTSIFWLKFYPDNIQILPCKIKPTKIAKTQQKWDA